LEEAGKHGKTWSEVQRLAGNSVRDASQMSYVPNGTKGSTTTTKSKTEWKGEVVSVFNETPHHEGNQKRGVVAPCIPKLATKWW
jgi:hypothetical protein